MRCVYPYAVLFDNLSTQCTKTCNYQQNFTLNIQICTSSLVNNSKNICPANKPYQNEVFCISSCPSYISDYKCVSSCIYPYSFLLSTHSCSSTCTINSNNTCVSFCPLLYSPLSQNHNQCISVCQNNLILTQQNLCVSLCEKPFKKPVLGLVCESICTFFVDSACVSTCPILIQLQSCVDFCSGSYAFPSQGRVCSSQCALTNLDGLRRCDGDCDYINISNERRCVSACGGEYQILLADGNNIQCLQRCSECAQYCSQNHCVSACSDGYAYQMSGNECSSTCIFQYKRNQQFCIQKCAYILVNVSGGRQQCYSLCQVENESCLGCPQDATYYMGTCQCKEGQIYIISKGKCECENDRVRLENGMCASCPGDSSFANGSCECKDQNSKYSEVSNICQCNVNYSLQVDGICRKCPSSAVYNYSMQNCSCGIDFIYSNDNNSCFCKPQLVYLTNQSCMRCPQFSLFINLTFCNCTVNSQYSLRNNDCGCNQGLALLQNGVCAPCPTNSNLFNYTCICSINATYNISNNSCICNLTYVQLLNFSCQLCPNDAIFIKNGNTCNCSNQAYSNINNSCSCPNYSIGQYLSVSQCVSHCDSIIQTGRCVSQCAQFSPYLQNNNCVSSCFTFLLVQQQSCVVRCNGSFIQNGTYCSNNCVINYNGTNFCMTICNSTNITQYGSNIVNQTCIPASCLQTNQSILQFPTPSVVTIVPFNTIVIGLMNLTVNNTICDVSYFQFQEQSYSLFYNCTTCFNIQIIGQLPVIPSQSCVSLLNWNSTSATTFYCILIQLGNITIPYSSSQMVIVQSVICSLVQFTVTNMLISTNISNSSQGSYCIFLNQSSINSSITAYNLTISGNFCSQGVRNSLFINNTWQSNLTILNCSVYVPLFQSFKNSIVSSNDVSSNFTLVQFIILACGTTASAGTQAFGGNFSQSNLTFIDSSMNIVNNFLNAVQSTGLIQGYSSGSLWLIQSNICGNVKLSNVSQNYNVGIIGIASATTMTWVTVNISIQSSRNDDYFIGFIANSQGNLNVSQNTININFINGSQWIGTFGFINASISLSGASVNGTILGSYYVGLLVGELTGYSNLSFLNISGIFQFNTGQCSLVIGSLNQDSKIINVKILSAVIQNNANYSGSFIGIVYNPNYCRFVSNSIPISVQFTSCNVFNVVTNGNQKFGLVVGGLLSYNTIGPGGMGYLCCSQLYSFGITITNCTTSYCCGQPDSKGTCAGVLNGSIVGCL